MPDGTPKMTTIYVNDDDTTARVHYQQVPQNQNNVPSSVAVAKPQSQSQPTQQAPQNQNTSQNTNGQIKRQRV